MRSCELRVHHKQSPMERDVVTVAGAAAGCSPAARPQLHWTPKSRCFRRQTSSWLYWDRVICPVTGLWAPVHRWKKHHHGRSPCRCSHWEQQPLPWLLITNCAGGNKLSPDLILHAPHQPFLTKPPWTHTEEHQAWWQRSGLLHLHPQDDSSV